MFHAWRSTAERANSSARQFAVLTAIWQGTECVLEKTNATHGVENAATAGCISGAAIAARQGPQAACMGCAGFAAFSVVIDQVWPH